jgi:molybdopterin-guanine dinucleotide biosynthesis protein A
MSAIDVEAVLLTGGQGKRMGFPKSGLELQEGPLDGVLAGRLLEVCSGVTVLGSSPLEGCSFLADQEEFAGPRAALSRFSPSEAFVFVLACDVPLFDPRLVEVLRSEIGGADAAVPVLDGRAQPLCALYKASAWEWLRVNKGDRLMEWLDGIEVAFVDEASLEGLGVEGKAVQGCNTREEFLALTGAPL